MSDPQSPSLEAAVKEAVEKADRESDRIGGLTQRDTFYLKAGVRAGWSAREADLELLTKLRCASSYREQLEILKMVKVGQSAFSPLPMPEAEAAKSLAAPQDTARLAKDAVEEILFTALGRPAEIKINVAEKVIQRAIDAAMGVSPQPPAKKETTL